MQHTGALPCREAGFRAMIHVAVSEPLLSRGGGSGATGHVAALEPTLSGWLDPVLWGTWHRAGAHPAPCLDLKLICRGTRSAGYRQNDLRP
jgi:hypothetical protein